MPTSSPASRKPVIGAVALCAAVVLSACAAQKTADEKTAGWSPNKIYNEARSEADSGGYEQAIPLYTVLEGRASGTTLAQQAMLEKAYAQYKNGDTTEAGATLDRFLRLYPASPATDYALYMKGVIHFNGANSGGALSFLTKMDLRDRDQHAARESFAAFKQLLEQYPESRYAADARKRMTYIVNALAASDVSIANYYFRRAAYVAAINRAQHAIVTYGATPSQEEALAIMAASYQALGLEQPHNDTQRVLEQNYPNSPYLSGYSTKRKSFFKLW